MYAHFSTEQRQTVNNSQVNIFIFSTGLSASALLLMHGETHCVSVTYFALWKWSTLPSVIFFLSLYVNRQWNIRLAAFTSICLWKIFFSQKLSLSLWRKQMSPSNNNNAPLGDYVTLVRTIKLDNDTPNTHHDVLNTKLYLMKMKLFPLDSLTLLFSPLLWGWFISPRWIDYSLAKSKTIQVLIECKNVISNVSCTTHQANARRVFPRDNESLWHKLSHSQAMWSEGGRIQVNMDRGRLSLQRVKMLTVNHSHQWRERERESFPCQSRIEKVTRGIHFQLTS